MCRGKFIGLLNSGDWYEPETFESVQQFFRVHQGTGVFCGALQYWDGDKIAYAAESRPELLEREMSITHPTCFVEREVYLEHGGYDPAYNFAMDYEQRTV